MAKNDFATNGNDGMLMPQNTRWSIGTEWRLGYNYTHGYEAETKIFGQTIIKDNCSLLSLGIKHTLPMLVRLQSEVFTEGNNRFLFGHHSSEP